MMTYIYGASGHGKVIYTILRDSGVVVDGFIDANEALHACLGLSVRHGEHFIVPEDKLIVAIGDNATRQKIAGRLPVRFLTAIHPTAIIDASVRVGEGTAVMQGAIVQVGAAVGRHAILNTGCTIDHDCELGDFVHISPRATLCGQVSVGDLSWIGAGAVVKQCVRIGRGCIIGAGAVVLRDVPDGAMALGNPARILPPSFNL
jgi:sugar O-acyltransferase (sialic acid O-acetyltransferase NeuD family)